MAQKDKNTEVNLLIEQDEVRKLGVFITSKNINVNEVSEENPLYLSKAIFLNKPDIVKVLLDKGGDLLQEGSDGLTPLNELVISGTESMFQFILEYDPNVFKKSKYLNLEYISALKKRTTITRLLGEQGIDVTDYVNDLLYLSALRGEIDNVRFYVEQGADVNYIKDEVSVMTAAIENKFPEIVSYLENKGSFDFDFNQKNIDNNKDWFKIIFQNDPDLLNHYIAKGCDINMKNEDGETALDLAKKYNLNNLIHRLENN